MEQFIESGKGEILLLVIFGILISVLLFLDLFVLNTKNEKITTRSAFKQTLVWVSFGLGFGVLVYFLLPSNVRTERVIEYYSAYLTEYSLSIDNIFVIMLILHYFNIKEKYYHKILFWGIFGAIFFRAFFIFVGSYLVHHFEWILYIFGAFLVYSGIKLFFEEKNEEELDPDKNILFVLARKFLPIINRECEGKLWVRRQGHFYFTRIFLVILLIESTDIIFAIDSIPAAFAITQDEYVLYTSNMFSVLGLRAMFFLLAGIVDRFHYLPKGIAVILTFIGLKMLLKLAEDFFGIHLEVPTYVSLIVIVVSLTASVILSLIFPKKEENELVNSTNNET